MYAPPLSWSAPGDGDLPECSHDEAASPPRPRTITRVTIAGLAEAAPPAPTPAPAPAPTIARVTIAGLAEAAPPTPTPAPAPTIARVTIAGLAEAAAAKPAPREGQQQQGQGEQVLPQVLRSFHGLSQTRRFKLRF